ncbi:uncharacterized protein [Littorina saxatilis]|uniref:Uncharacterized protein n=1 Tax=Littorina saxatilis TaxID=31220 RepID=A0AAN9G4S0_9CAEN
MKLLACLVAVGFLAMVWAEEQKTEEAAAVAEEVAEPVSVEVDERFVLDVDQVMKQYGADDDKQEDSSDRKRRSALSLLNPASYRVRGHGYRYRDAAPVTLGYYGYDDTPVTVGGLRRGAYFRAAPEDGDRFSFVRFYNSFTPQRAVRTNGNVYVRNYVRRGSFDDCLTDFHRLSLQQIKAVSSSDMFDNDNNNEVVLLSGVRQTSTSSGLFGNVERDSTVGYVGVMRDFPYQVYAMREGCYLDGYSGYHDCIVFKGATYPYSKTVRRFVYVNQQSAASAAVDTVDRVVADRYVSGGFGDYGAGRFGGYGVGRVGGYAGGRFGGYRRGLW